MRIKGRVAAPLGLPLLIIGAGCYPAQPDAAPRPLRLAGSTTVAPLARSAAEAYQVRYPQAVFEIRQSSTGEGLATFIRGEADVAMATRPPTQREFDAAEAAGRHLRLTVVAHDALAIVVHPDNQLRDLTLDQVADVFFGERPMQWPELPSSGLSGKVRVYHTSSAVSGTAGLFEAVMLETQPSGYVDGSVEVHPTPDVVPSVAEDRQAIGYTPLKWVDETVRLLTIDGNPASGLTALYGAYPFSRRLYLITDGEPSGLARGLLSYLLSPAGQKVTVRDTGFYPVF